MIAAAACAGLLYSKWHTFLNENCAKSHSPRLHCHKIASSAPPVQGTSATSRAVFDLRGDNGPVITWTVV